MSGDPLDTRSDPGGRWDRLFDQLAAEPRRLVVVSLMDAPKERRLPLPDAICSPDLSVDRDRLALQLRHRHLPRLAEAGYVRWDDDPFCVQRGPNFEQAAAVLRVLAAGSDRLPDSLVDGCPLLAAGAKSD